MAIASDAARQRVSRDLHEGAWQGLATTLVNLQLAEQGIHAPARESCSARLSAIPGAGSKTCGMQRRTFIQWPTCSGLIFQPRTDERL